KGHREFASGQLDGVESLIREEVHEIIELEDHANPGRVIAFGRLSVGSYCHNRNGRKARAENVVIIVVPSEDVDQKTARSERKPKGRVVGYRDRLLLIVDFDRIAIAARPGAPSKVREAVAVGITGCERKAELSTPARIAIVAHLNFVEKHRSVALSG